MAWSLETDGFLKALTRMVARRGWPTDMFGGDNGTNFVRGNNELLDLVQHLDQNKIQWLTSKNGIRWHWNPPLAPHFGGVFERIIYFKVLNHSALLYICLYLRVVLVSVSCPNMACCLLQ